MIVNVTKKQLTAKAVKPQERGMISIRNISPALWKAVQDKAKSEGKYPWSVVEMLFNNYLSEQG